MGAPTKPYGEQEHAWGAAQTSSLLLEPYSAWCTECPMRDQNPQLTPLPTLFAKRASTFLIACRVEFYTATQLLSMALRNTPCFCPSHCFWLLHVCSARRGDGSPPVQSRPDLGPSLLVYLWYCLPNRTCIPARRWVLWRKLLRWLGFLYCKFCTMPMLAGSYLTRIRVVIPLEASWRTYTCNGHNQGWS